MFLRASILRQIAQNFTNALLTTIALSHVLQEVSALKYPFAILSTARRMSPFTPPFSRQISSIFPNSAFVSIQRLFSRAQETASLENGNLWKGLEIYDTTMMQEKYKLVFSKVGKI